MWYNLFWKRLDLVQSHIEWKLWELLVAGTMVASWPAPWLRSKCPNKVLLLLSPPLHHFPYLMTPLKQIKTLFLSDPSPIIGNPRHWLPPLTPWRLVDLFDVTLACEDTNSKLVELRMLMLRIMLAIVCWRFGAWGLVIKLNFLIRLWAPGLIKILKLKFRLDLKLEFG